VPLSEKAHDEFSQRGGVISSYHFVPGGNINDFTFGENQLGVELMGHSANDHTRYAASMISSTNGTWDCRGTNLRRLPAPEPGVHGGGAGVAAGGSVRLGRFPPTTSRLSDGWCAHPRTGIGNALSTGLGYTAACTSGKFDLTGVYQHASDNVYLGNATAGNATLPEGARVPRGTRARSRRTTHILRSCFFLAVTNWCGCRSSRWRIPPATWATPTCSRWATLLSVHAQRADLAWHQEFATGRFRKTSESGQDQRNNSYFMGLDFAF